MISSIANLIYELPHELPNYLRLRILGKKQILGKSQIWVETSRVPPPDIKLWPEQSKNTQKQISNFSYPIQPYWISLPCSTYLVQDCLSKQSFGLHSPQSPSTLVFLTFSISSKYFFSLYEKCKAGQLRYASKFNGSWKQYFAYLAQVKN